MNYDRRGLIGTITFHIVVLALFIFFGFRTPLPLPEEAGMLINFGDSDFGAGIEEPLYTEEIAPQPVEEVIQETIEEVVKETQLLTQETEEAPSVAVKKIKKKKTEKKKEPAETKPEPKKAEPKKEVKPKVYKPAMYSGRKANTNYTGPQGNTKGKGNQGKITGDVDATNYGLGGGTGNKPGFYLQGRNAVSLPTPKINSQETGKVVVRIKVDRDGNVVDAIPGVKGSTTLNSYLLGVAKKAALRSKFDENQDAAWQQSGTITYIFHLK